MPDIKNETSDHGDINSTWQLLGLVVLTAIVAALAAYLMFIACQPVVLPGLIMGAACFTVGLYCFIHACQAVNPSLFDKTTPYIGALSLTACAAGVIWALNGPSALTSIATTMTLGLSNPVTATACAIGMAVASALVLGYALNRAIVNTKSKAISDISLA